MLSDLIERMFGGSRSRAAEAFGVSQPFLSDFLNGRKGAGRKLIDGVAKYDKKSASAMMGTDVGASALPVGVDRCIAQLVDAGEAPELALQLALIASRLTGSEDPEELYRTANTMATVGRALSEQHRERVASSVAPTAARRRAH